MQDLASPFRGVLDDYLPLDQRVPRFVVLFVCTANVCRSPMAQALAATLMPENKHPVEFRSAGAQAHAAHHVDATALAILAERGASGAQQPARALTAGQISGAGLILTAEREHRAGVLRLAPEALNRTFTLLEFARVISSLDCGELRSAYAAGGPGEVVCQASRHRGPVRALADDRDALADPIGGSVAAFRACADAITTALAIVLPALFPPAE